LIQYLLALTEPSNPLARISAGQCLKFCDDTPSVATPRHKTGNISDTVQDGDKATMNY